MFVTIITIILLTIAFVLWAIIYGGSQNVSGAEQKFDGNEEAEFVTEKNLKEVFKMSFLVYQKQSPEFLNNYLKYKRFISCCSATTVDQAYFDLRTFFRYISIMFHSNTNIENISVNVLNNCSKTTNRKLASIKRLFEYLYTNNKISSNPSKGIESASIKKRIPKYLTLDQSKQMLSNTINSDSQNKIRNYAITCIFLNCSLRVSELIYSFIFFLAERHYKERTGYLNAITKEALQKYLDIRNTITTDKKNSDYLFLNKYKEKITTEGIRITLKKAYKKAGIDNNKYSTHTLRHTCATVLYRSGIDIKVIQELLGHTKVETTEIYTHLYDEEVFDAMQKHPLSKFKMKNAMEYCEMAS